jgi:hypothetical protein
LLGRHSTTPQAKIYLQVFLWPAALGTRLYFAIECKYLMTDEFVIGNFLKRYTI